ncbi:bacillithiol system redox-active protein YtxJ [Larkinella punicea]|uniref:Bacillithiol system redox-active protein YtxJ n=1 Tax=Larkinella punicea TaxID=2315727 RepID=A0A368JKM0_9BACT|nr:bacillithiol system redox-active protein YtxJ [Larkinella punicea]RCR68198.1 bacillithiol system redox-active protein YtxJ [Larkinella punicea]RZJ24513.1 MAG: bacillithiol system redox-active protein YtxJ [Flavobacterium sp.]
MNWNKLQDNAQLAQIKQESAEQPVLIFKHSTRCSISSTALSRMERNWSNSVGIKPYYLDLIAFRSVSGQVADEFGVDHQSPQVLLIQNGECIYDASHFEISFDDLKQQVVSA